MISFFYCIFCCGFYVVSDIQAFTSELKNKLATKCRGKAKTDFTQVVKEIHEEYDDKGTEKEEFIPDIDDGKSKSCIDESLKDWILQRKHSLQNMIKSKKQLMSERKC